MRPSLRARDRGNYKESAACPITKASNCSHFHLPLFFFCSLLSQPCSIRDFFLFLIRFLFVRGTVRGNYKESATCPITKASNSSHFHIPLMFCSLLSQPCSIRDFFSLFDTFLHLRNFKNAFSVVLLYHRPLNKVKPCCAGLVLGWVTIYEHPVL